MPIIGIAIDFLLQIAFWLLIARFIIDWVTVLARAYRPSGIVAALFEIVYSLTDPAIRALRSAIPPIRIGQVSLDISIILLLLLLRFLRSINAMIFF